MNAIKLDERKRGGRRSGVRGAILGALAVATLALSACTVGAPSTDNAPETGDTLLDKVKGGELKLAFTAFEPQSFQSATGEWTGYDIDILEGFAETLDAELVVEQLPFDASIQAVSSKRADITIDIFWTAERAEAIDFSRPMLNYRDVVIVRKSNPLATEATLEGMAGKKIGATAGAVGEKEARATPDAEVVTYGEYADKLLALKQGRVDAIYTTNTNAAVAMTDPNNDLEYLGPVPDEVAAPIETVRGYYGVAKGEYSASFLEELNAYLKEITCNGELQTILDDYDLTQDVWLMGLCEAPDDPGLQ